MNGAGTQENPYVIMNADDLYSMGTVGDNQTYFSLGADIDFNDTQYGENFVPILLNCRELAGNGHVIRNVNYNVTDENASMFIVYGGEEEAAEIDIKELRVENVRLTGKDVFVFGNGGGTSHISLNHCVFVFNDIVPLTSTKATETHKHCIMHENDIIISADYCTFVMSIYFQRIYAVFSGDTVMHTQIRLEMRTNVYQASNDKYNGLFSGSSVSDSYAFIKVNVYDTSKYGAVELTSSDNLLNRCYFVIELPSTVTGYLYGTVGSICFYDLDVLRKTNRYANVVCTESNSLHVRALSTSNCKNAAYLRSIGFNCLEENA